MTIDRRKLLGLGAGVAGAGLTGFLPKVLAWFKPAALLGPITRVEWTPGIPVGEFEDLPASLIKHGPIDLEFPGMCPTFVEGMAAIEGNTFRVQFPDGADWVFSGYITNWDVVEDGEPDERGLSVSIQPTGVRFDDCGADIVDLDAEGGPRRLSDGMRFD